MAVGGIGSSYMQDTGLPDMLRSLRKGTENISDEAGASAMNLPANATNPAAPQAASTRPGMMSDNFASAKSSESRYVAAAKNSFAVAKQQSTQQTNRVTALLQTLGGVNGPQLYGGPGSKRPIQEATVRLALKRVKDTETQEASERNLEDIKDDIEKRAAQAAAPKDENGEPIEMAAAEAVAPSATPPEISTPAPATGSAVPQSTPIPTTSHNAAINAYNAAVPSPDMQSISITV